jgi:hypothetical protein
VRADARRTLGPAFGITALFEEIYSTLRAGPKGADLAIVTD